MRLNKTQINYAVSRLADFAKERTEKKVAATIGECPSLPPLNFKTQLALIRSGKAVLKRDDELFSYTDLNDAYEYPTHKKEKEAAQKKVDAWLEKRNAIAAKIEVERQALHDKLMLADGGEEVLALLDSFANA